jgi:hypothetical protein
MLEEMLLEPILVKGAVSEWDAAQMSKLISAYEQRSSELTVWHLSYPKDCFVLLGVGQVDADDASLKILTRYNIVVQHRREESGVGISSSLIQDRVADAGRLQNSKASIHR